MFLLKRNKLVLLLALLHLFLYSNGQNKEQIKKQRNEISKKITLTNKLLEETRKEKKQSEQSLILLNKQAAYRNQLIDSYSRETRGINRNIKLNKEEIDNQEKELTALKEEYAHLINQAYKNRDSYDKLMFLFSSSSFNQAYKRMKFIQQYTTYRKKQAEVIKQKSFDLLALNDSLSIKKQQKQVLIKEKEKEKEALNSTIASSKQTLGKLQQNESELRKQLKQQIKQRAKLNKEIDRIIAAEIKKSRKANAGTFKLTPEAKELSNKFSKNKGKLPWPTEKGVITGTFGIHSHPVLPGIKIENNGIDIATESGSVVRAVYKGTVSAILDFKNMGKAVIVNHGAYRTVYSNLNEVFVKQGQAVDTKQFLGTVLTNRQTGKTEAHFEILYINSKGQFIKQNPALWISH